MNEIFQCGDQGALVGYLYDECTPEERDAIALHLTRCVSCAAEIGGLTSTRRALAAWTPPQIDLGIQITRRADVDAARLAGNVISFARPQPASVEGTSWWKAPLPAWAQVAAAMVIFAAGFSLGFMRDGARATAVPEATTASAVPHVTTASTQSGPSKADLELLEQRLRTEIAQLAHASAPAVAPVPVTVRSGDVTMEQVKALIADSERKQNIDFTERAVRQNAAFEAQRRADLESIGSRIVTLQGQTGQQLGQLQQGFNILANRVSLQK